MQKTLTKRIVITMLIISTIGGFMPYCLSLLRCEPVIEVGVGWITSGVAVCLGYMVRGYKDSRSIAELGDIGREIN